jgi:hypothetical protein
MEDLDRLRFYVEKRLQTTMIGAISKFENNFGFLWGQDIEKDEDLTPQQLEFADMWERTRNQVLNQGNAQIRNIKDDFYKWGGLFKQNFNYSFKVPKDSEDSCSNCKCSNKKTN